MENEREKLLAEATEAIISLVEEKKYAEARKRLLELNAVDIAEVITEIVESLGLDRAIVLFRLLPKDTSVDVFSYLDLDDQVDIINRITDKEIHFIIDELDFDDMIDVLEELPANIVDKILEKTPKDERRLINTFLHYPDNSAGSLMTPDYVFLRKGMTVKGALAHIKEVGMDKETVYTCYVVEQRVLLGIVSLRNLVISDEEILIENLMHEDLVSVNVLEDQEDVAETFKKYDFLALPVVDKENRMVGIITVDDILDIIDEENTEDIERMAGVIDGSDKDYLAMRVFDHVKARFPWLLFLMISSMVTGLIITRFEGLLSEVLSLVSYLPLLMGTGGNSGAQAATLIIRGMAVGDIDPGDAGKILWKEFRVSIVVGLALSVINFAKILFLDGEPVLVALTVCISIVVIIALAKCLGSMLPILAKALKIDPALMASPMIASLTDMASVVAYFALATLILGI